jgi:RHS repeat-associated protein
VYDANDTVLDSSWYSNRTNRLIDVQLLAEGKDPAREKEAADKAAKHANTPNVLHFDTLGRPVLSVDHNRNITTQTDEYIYTKTSPDVEGNLRKVTDARGNTVMLYKYNMLGNLAYQNSMDAGQRWLLINIVGNPLRTWDERNHEFQYFYDILHRPTYSKVIAGDGASPLDHIFEKIIYGESLLLANRSNEVTLQTSNVLGKAIKHYDTGGLTDTPEYDFKGQPLATTRYLFKKYKEVVNWTDANLASDLESDAFTFSTVTDALGRITQQKAPDGSVITPSYNEAGLLNTETVKHAKPDITTVYIKNIDYNEKGQRNKITYGNNVTTRFYYDKETFCLKRLETKRQNNEPLQDWHYTFDAIGNITHIEDKNIPVTFFNNQKITGMSEYTYDALYRLISATGRENDAALMFNNKDNWNDAPFMHQLNPSDPIAARNYTQNYYYDQVGNIVQMKHTASGNNWTRNYTYETANNRLKSTQVGSETYRYTHHPLHGYIAVMPHLEEISWNFKEELVKSIRQRRTDGGTPETTWYQYDGQGQRIRKITENEADAGNTSALKEERIYISGYELYKSYSGSSTGLERTSLSLMDEGHRFVMIDTETEPRQFLGIPTGRTSPVQTIRYQLHNHLGSASLELDENSQVISYEEYHPYGTTAYQAQNAIIKAAAKRYRYTGMERDEETGLEYHSARYYMPWLGRWLSADPIGIGGGINFYGYVSGNPVRKHDLNGLQEKKYPPCEDELDAGVGDCPSLPGATPPDTLDGVGDPAWTITDEQRIKEGRPLATAGAAPPEQAQKGYVLAGPGKKELQWAKKEYKQQVKAGVFDATIGQLIAPLGIPILSFIAPDTATELGSLRPKTDLHFTQDIASGTNFLLSSLIMASLGGLKLNATGTRLKLDPNKMLPPGTQLNLFSEAIPETKLTLPSTVPTPPEIPYRIDIGEVKSTNWSVNRTINYQGKFIFQEGLDLNGGVQASIRYTPDFKLQVDLRELGGMEGPIGKTYVLDLDQVMAQQRTVGLKFGSSAYGNVMESLAVERVGQATGQVPVIKPANQGGADFLPIQLQFRGPGF